MEDKNLYVILPLELITNKKYGCLSSNSKILYCLLLNRMNYSKKNLKRFSDSKGIFIHYGCSQIQKHLGCSRHTAIDLLRQLEQAGLIRKEYQKRGLPLKIYVNDIRAGGGQTAESRSEKPQKRFDYSGDFYSKERTKPATGQMKYKDREVSFDIELAKEMAKKHRMNFAEKSPKRKKKHPSEEECSHM